VAKSELDDDALIPSLCIDAEIALAETQDPAMAEAHASLGPFGAGNPQPVFVSTGVTPEYEPRWLKEKHLSLTLRHGRVRQRAIYFGAPREELPTPPWDVAFKIEPDDYGEQSIALHVQGIRTSQYETS
jgi:single-stranded-DNA-specific exonuclease